MASSSVTLPDQSSLSISPRGSILQSPDRPTVNPLLNLVDYFTGQEWRDDALCLEIDTDLFFPERGIPGEEIRDVCFSCPVRLECLNDSVLMMPKFGWFGGHPKEGRTRVRSLMREDNLDLVTADALVLADMLEKVRQRKVAEKGRGYSLVFGEEIIGEHVLVS